MCDWDGKALAEALAQRHKIPSLIRIQNQYMNRDWAHKVHLVVCLWLDKCARPVSHWPACLFFVYLYACVVPKHYTD